MTLSVTYSKLTFAAWPGLNVTKQECFIWQRLWSHVWMLCDMEGQPETFSKTISHQKILVYLAHNFWKGIWALAKVKAFNSHVCYLNLIFWSSALVLRFLRPRLHWLTLSQSPILQNSIFTLLKLWIYFWPPRPAYPCLVFKWQEE